MEEGRVFFHFGSYGTACLNSENGKVVWSRRDLPCNHFRGPGSSPILYGNLLIMHFDGFDYQYVVALDKLTGETVWKVDRSNDYQTDDGDLKKAFSTPLVIDFDGKKQLISPGSKALFSYDPMTGKENWQVNYKGFSGTARPLFGHGLVFVSTGFSKAEMLAVRPVGTGNVTESNIAWRASRAIPSKPSPILVEDLIYMVDDQGVASCLEAVTGDRVWTKRLVGNFSASPVYAGGLIYFCSHEGETFVIKPSRVFTKVAVNLLEDGFMASPAVSDNALILRTRSCLYRIEQSP